MTITGITRATVTGGLAVGIILATLGTPAIAAPEDDISPAAESALSVAIPIDSENLIELYQSVPGLRIVDARLLQDHRLGHIERSRNLPVNETSCDSLARLTEGRDTAMVFYCNGRDGSASIDALQVASNCGYRRLFWLRGGFIEWQDKDYPFVVE